MSWSAISHCASTRMLPRLAALTVVAAALGGCAGWNSDSDSTSASIPKSGPQGSAGTPEGCAADRMDDNALVGKQESEVMALLQGCAWRLGERDGSQFPGTMDFDSMRRTLGIAGGIVVWVRRG